jgi:hypothetical protein
MTEFKDLLQKYLTEVVDEQSKIAPPITVTASTTNSYNCDNELDRFAFDCRLSLQKLNQS